MPDFIPFDDSRRLTGFNLYFRAVGAVLETRGPLPDESTLQAWDIDVQRAGATLGWPAGERVVRRHRGGASLALSAPLDQLFCATEVNEWAWTRAYEAAHGPLMARFHAPGHPAVWDEDAAMKTLHAYAAAEREQALLALVEAANQCNLQELIDDEQLSIGAGDGAVGWPLTALPSPDALDWGALHRVPVALVTGSNGKTTTVRLLAAMARAHGWHTGHSCTDGVFVDDRLIDGGDYSGPAGARAVLRAPGVPGRKPIPRSVAACPLHSPRNSTCTACRCAAPMPHSRIASPCKAPWACRRIAASTRGGPRYAARCNRPGNPAPSARNAIGHVSRMDCRC